MDNPTAATKTPKPTTIHPIGSSKPRGPEEPKEEPKKDKSDSQVCKSPEGVTERRGFADAARRGEGRLKPMAADTLNEMWDAVGKQQPADEFEHVKVPRHFWLPFIG